MSLRGSSPRSPARTLPSWDYLADDVLARQDDGTRHFLLRTSILADLTPSLCDWLCDCADSAQRLRRLDRDHLFLIPVDAGGDRWRYHSMFAEFLRTQLKRQHPEEVSQLHRSAAAWFLEQGRPIPAVEHLLAADDIAAALNLLGQHAQGLLEQGRVRLLSRWLDALHGRDMLDAYPMLQVVHAWAVCLARGPRAAEPLLARLEQIANPTKLVLGHRQAMRPLFLVLSDRTEEAMRLTPALLADMPAGAAFVRGFMEVVLANLAMIAGQYHEALRLADAARSRQPGHHGNFNMALSEAVEGAVDLTQGRLRKAIAHLRLAVSAGASEVSRATNGNAMAGVLLAEALYEANQCDQAERLLTVYIPLIRAVGIPDQLIIAHTVMARIAAQRGDGDKAQRLLAELEHVGHRECLARVVASARLERARMLMIDDRLAPARVELDRSGDKVLWARVGRLSLRANEVETHDVGLARWTVLGNRPGLAIAGLRAELDAAEQAQRERRALTLRLILAQAYHQSGQHNKAMRLLAKAIRLAAAEGYVRAFLDEGPVLFAMLKKLTGVPSLLGGDHEPGAPVAAFLDRLVGVSHPTTESAPGRAPGLTPSSNAPRDNLTRKELLVLHLLAEGLSNSELAERLFVAETTVRTHLRNINSKLGARNRTEAIAVSRRAGLIG